MANGSYSSAAGLRATAPDITDTTQHHMLALARLPTWIQSATRIDRPLAIGMWQLAGLMFDGAT